MFFFFFFKQKTAYEMRISDWSSDVCSSDLGLLRSAHAGARGIAALRHEAVDHPVKQNAVVKAFAGQFLDPLDMAGSKVRPQPDGDVAAVQREDEGVFGVGHHSLQNCTGRI